jgi:branched-chain amino acid transport system ATP-binding protein
MTTSGRSMLTLDGVDAFRGEAHILHQVSFEVPRNEVTAILGRNGAGKTTTIMAILGLLKSVGSVVLDGEDLSGLPVHKRVLKGIGYVPEDREVFTDLTVAENMRLAARGAVPPERRTELATLFPILTERAQQRAGTLSGGQQQMIAIARALLNDNRILLIDEPSKGLAPAVVTDMVVAIENVKAASTILLVEQNLAVAARLADHVVVLDQGRVVFSGRMQQFAQDKEATMHWLGVDIKAKGREK